MTARLLLCAHALLATAAAADLYIAVGYGGRRAASRDGIAWEHDQRWSDEAKDDDNVLFNVAWGHGGAIGPGRFVVVGGGAKTGHILTTRDGREWRALPQLKGRVATIAFGKGRFVAGHDAELLSSTDGETFTPGTRLDWKGSVHARKSVFGDGEGGGMFVIIGDVDLWAEKQRVSWRVATSDGVSFSKAEHGTAAARDIAFGAGHFVVVGPQGLIESSHDGITWTRRESDPGEDFHDVAWTGARFFARGKDTWSSRDGLAWQREPRRVPCTIGHAREGGPGIGFAWGGGVFFSRDLVEWKKQVLAPGPSFTAIARGEAP